MSPYQKLVLKLLAAILHAVMSIKEDQTGSHYAWKSERELLQEVYKETR